MNKILKLAALLTALALCLSFAACGGNDSENTTAPAETTIAAPDETLAEPVDATQATDETISDDTTAAIDESSVPADGSTSPDESSAPAEVTTVAQPASTAEIVALFNNSANAVRKDRPGYTCNTTNYVNKVTAHDSAALQRIADTALNFINADPSSETVAKGASHNSFGASSTSYASALDANFVKSATCTKSGNNYVIKITLKDESLADLPQDASKTSTGKAMLVLGASEVYEQTDKIPGVTILKFAPTYSDCTIDATVNATTGKLTSCTYYWHSVNDVQAKIIGFTAGADVDFAIKRAYSLNY